LNKKDACIGRGYVQQLTYSRKIIAAPGISEQPIVTDAMKATGQNVQQETTHELIRAERHRFMARDFSVVCLNLPYFI